MSTHDHPAVRGAALNLIAPSGDLYDKALLMHHDPGGWRLMRLIEAAAKVRAGLDALDAAIAKAAEEAAEAEIKSATSDMTEAKRLWGAAGQMRLGAKP